MVAISQRDLRICFDSAQTALCIATLRCATQRGVDKKMFDLNFTLGGIARSRR
jgi:hypothetical protein